MINLLSPHRSEANYFSSESDTFLIDDFEDGNFSFNPEWFQFGESTFIIKDNSENDNYKKSFFQWLKSLFKKKHKDEIPDVDEENSIIGTQSLAIKGKATEWYLCGIGTYLAIDVQDYDELVLYIKGDGKHSGRLKIELFDDDNDSWNVEQDLEDNFKPIFDDLFKYEIEINWDKWRKITIPFSKFKDDNPGVGDDIWNPFQYNNSGGLIQIQLVALTPRKAKRAHIRFSIDQLYFQ
ncbi:hypothetical protein ACFL2K_02165 [Candidatus Margulisiibacteriota bacterium]